MTLMTLEPAATSAGIRLSAPKTFPLCAPIDLREDRACVQMLLDAFLRELDTHRRADLLRLAIDLFDTQTRIAEFAGLPVGCAATAGLFDLIEIVEMTHPGGRLYMVRGRELARLMQLELARQDRSLSTLDPNGLCIDPELLHFRKLFLGRARSLLGQDITPPPAESVRVELAA